MQISRFDLQKFQFPVQKVRGGRKMLKKKNERNMRFTGFIIK